MNSENPYESIAPKGSIEDMGPGETKLIEIHKHPFGIIWLYIQTLVGMTFALGLMFILLNQFVTDDNAAQMRSIFGLVAVLAVGATLLVLFVAGFVYRQNFLIVTNKNITEVLQRNLFNRQVSELSMANIEDISSFQKGVFATMFNYGTMVVETAGEQNNFVFTFCPRPSYHCKILLDARQRYVEADPVRATVQNNRLNLPPNFQQMPQEQPYQPPQPQQISEQPPQQPPENPTSS